jgi:hypothetical protein
MEMVWPEGGWEVEDEREKRKEKKDDGGPHMSLRAHHAMLVYGCDVAGFGSR